MNFSRSTIVHALELFNQQCWTVNHFKEYLLLFKLENEIPAGTKPTRVNALRDHFIANPALKGPNGANIVFETIEYVLKSRPLVEPASLLLSLTRSLLLDGYTINNDGTLRAILPPSIPLAPKETEVETLLSKFGFSVAKEHLQQALNAHSRGDWAAANGQMRTFVESLFDSFADKLLKPLPTKSHLRREGLAELDPPFIDQKLNEWVFGTTHDGFVQGFWKRLHPEGSHPGLSDEDDSTFRLQLVHLVAHRFLKRFDTYEA